jgi:sulfur relay (sulfurtransferase) DsrF/TusC family protein
VANSIIILCEDSPFGKNSAIETIRMAAGLLVMEDIDDCKVVFMKDALYFLSQKLDPEAIGVDSFINIMRLIELSELELYVHDTAMEEAGMVRSDLLPIDNIKVVSIEEISQLILDADMSFKY